MGAGQGKQKRARARITMPLGYEEVDLGAVGPAPGSAYDACVSGLAAGKAGAGADFARIVSETIRPGMRVQLLKTKTITRARELRAGSIGTVAWINSKGEAVAAFQDKDRSLTPLTWEDKFRLYRKSDRILDPEELQKIEF